MLANEITSNDIRRIKIKLQLLEETEGLNWLLEDFHVLSMCYGHHKDMKDKILELKNQYKQTIQQNSPEDSKQGKLKL